MYAIVHATDRMNEMYESSVRPRPASATGDLKQGMLINCAAYHGGCRVADIDLDQAHKADTSDGGFVWITCTSRMSRCCARCSNALDCMTSLSRTR